MNCAEIERDQIVERYLARELSEDVRLQFEEHYFHCDRCFEEFEAMQAVRAALQEAGPPAVEKARPVSRWRLVWGVAALAAAALLVVLVTRPSPVAPIAQQPAATAPGEPSIAMLARVEPPPYSAPVLRGSEDPAAQAFRGAMRPYSQGDFQAAATALRGVVERYPASTDARYFLGICDLLNGDTEKAGAELESIVQAGDSTPYREEAEYYLALVHVKQNQRAAALAELQRVIDLHREYEAKAKDLAAVLGKQ